MNKYLTKNNLPNLIAALSDLTFFIVFFFPIMNNFTTDTTGTYVTHYYTGYGYIFNSTWDSIGSGIHYLLAFCIILLLWHFIAAIVASFHRQNGIGNLVLAIINASLITFYFMLYVYPIWAIVILSLVLATDVGVGIWNMVLYGRGHSNY